MHGLSREQSAPDESSKAVLKERDRTFAAFREAGLETNAEMRRSWKRAFAIAQAKEHRALRGKYVHTHKGHKPKHGISYRRK
jgi:hypothetical protein